MKLVGTGVIPGVDQIDIIAKVGGSIEGAGEITPKTRGSYCNPARDMGATGRGAQSVATVAHPKRRQARSERAYEALALAIRGTRHREPAESRRPKVKTGDIDAPAGSHGNGGSGPELAGIGHRRTGHLRRANQCASAAAKMADRGLPDSRGGPQVADNEDIAAAGCHRHTSSLVGIEPAVFLDPEALPARVVLRNEGVNASAVSDRERRPGNTLEGSRAEKVAGHIDVAALVHRHAIASVRACSAGAHRPKQRACGIVFGDENVAASKSAERANRSHV